MPASGDSIQRTTRDPAGNPHRRTHQRTALGGTPHVTTLRGPPPGHHLRGITSGDPPQGSPLREHRSGDHHSGESSPGNTREPLRGRPQWTLPGDPPQGTSLCGPHTVDPPGYSHQVTNLRAPTQRTPSGDPNQGNPNSAPSGVPHQVTPVRDPHRGTAKGHPQETEKGDPTSEPLRGPLLGDRPQGTLSRDPTERTPEETRSGDPHPSGDPLRGPTSGDSRQGTPHMGHR